ncbi:MAG: phosphate/phosphite/phosphonate ABC transporter substrate-binding protein [Desulfuromonadales bacterium]|nr:phosphate/phosphite/phosphonate ABC transporter substrate-binding protein [Desulfuromonadales bacterium]
MQRRPFCPWCWSALFRHLTASLVLALLLPAAGCDRQPEPVRVDPGKQSSAVVPARQLQQQDMVVRLGIGSMITPKEGYVYYRRLADYLEKKLESPVRIIDRGTYREFNDLLAGGGLDLAFVCGGPYVEGKADFDLQLLVVPETPDGETVYYAYLIVPASSPARSLDDLRGRRFAFTDPQSNTGRLVPTYMLSRHGETPEEFFGELIYTYAHDKSIQAVAAGKVDGAAVDSLIFDYLVAINPEIAGQVRILERSQPYGIPPVVVRPGLPEPLRERLRELLLDMHNDPEGKTILAGMMIERFVTGDDADYDGIRDIEEFIRGRQMKID